MTDNLFPIDEKILGRSEKETLLQQRGKVIWFYGLSGSGKSTLANALERKLHQEGMVTTLLDGDNIRSGLNAGLGFSDEDRTENIRRIAEVSKLFIQAGVIALNSFITPQNSLRKIAQTIISSEDLIQVYVECSYEECARRDVKGLYAKAKTGNVSNFTGKDSPFEIPENPDLTLNTEKISEAEALETLYQFIRPKLSL
jgi:adenylylsulfate kinase